MQNSRLLYCENTMTSLLVEVRGKWHVSFRPGQKLPLKAALKAHLKVITRGSDTSGTCFLQQQQKKKNYKTHYFNAKQQIMFISGAVTTYSHHAARNKASITALKSIK